MTYTIHNLPESERPRERLLRHGVDAVSTVELLAILLGSGVKGKSVLELSREIISSFGGVKQVAEATIEELCRIKGLGQTKAVQIKAGLGLGLRAAGMEEGKRIKIDHPSDVYALLGEKLMKEKREIFAIILQDVKGYLINHAVVSIGTLRKTLVHPREVFYPAIRHHAASLILAHNHPSGDPTPSQQDIHLTEQLIQAGEMMGIPVVDHVIIGSGQFYSLRQSGMRFGNSI